MDILEADKDTELPSHQKPHRIQALSHVFIGLGIALVLMMVFGLIGSLIAILNLGLNVSDLMNAESLSRLTTDTNSLRIMNLFGSAFPLIGAAIIGSLIAFKGKLKPLFGKLRFSGITLYASLIFFICCIPIIGILLEWNSAVDFSWISEGFHNWVVAKEKENNALYEIIAGNNSSSDLWLNLLLMALLPALGEELFFRGFLLNSLHGLTKNIHLSIGISALIFALIHMQFFKLMPMAFLGAAFGYLAYWNGSIWVAVFAHFANNAMAVISLHFYTDGNYEEVLSQEQNLPWAVIALAFAALIGIFIYVQKNSAYKLKNHYE